MRKVNGKYYDVNGCPISNNIKKYNIVDRKTNEIVLTFLAPNRFGGAHKRSYMPIEFLNMGLDFDEKYKYGAVSTMGEKQPIFVHKYLRETYTKG